MKISVITDTNIYYKNNPQFCGFNTYMHNPKIYKATGYKYYDRINYTWQHKKAFLRKEKEFLGKNTLDGWFHDSDKLLMYIIGVPQQLAHKIHTRFAPHHVRNGKIKNPVAAVIDWECAKLTKPDKQLDAEQTYKKYYPNVKEVKEVLDRFGF